MRMASKCSERRPRQSDEGASCHLPWARSSPETGLSANTYIKARIHALHALSLRFNIEQELNILSPLAHCEIPMDQLGLAKWRIHRRSRPHASIGRRPTIGKIATATLPGVYNRDNVQSVQYTKPQAALATRVFSPEGQRLAIARREARRGPLPPSFSSRLFPTCCAAGFVWSTVAGLSNVSPLPCAIFS